MKDSLRLPFKSTEPPSRAAQTSEQVGASMRGGNGLVAGSFAPSLVPASWPAIRMAP